jgi:hypothetical protein
MREPLFEDAGPAPRAVEDCENLNVIAEHSIRNNVGCAGHDKFTCPG